MWHSVIDYVIEKNLRIKQNDHAYSQCWLSDFLEAVQRCLLSPSVQEAGPMYSRHRPIYRSRAGHSTCLYQQDASGF